MSTEKQKPIIKVVDLAINSIQPNDYNPNSMGDNEFQALIEDIKSGNFDQPILVRTNPENGADFVIVDGEHRWKAAKEAGWAKIPSIIIKKNVPEAMIKTITMNHWRGDMDAFKLAQLIIELQKTYSLEELEAQLAVPSTELQGLIDLESMEMPNMGEPQEEREKPEKINFKIKITEKELQLIDKAVELTEIDETANAIIEICKSYISSKINNKKLTNV